jgi:FMN phosphatase YigB (HAD superfamily)
MGAWYAVAYVAAYVAAVLPYGAAGFGMGSAGAGLSRGMTARMPAAPLMSKMRKGGQSGPGEDAERWLNRDKEQQGGTSNDGEEAGSSDVAAVPEVLRKGGQVPIEENDPLRRLIKRKLLTHFGLPTPPAERAKVEASLPPVEEVFDPANPPAPQILTFNPEGTLFRPTQPRALFLRGEILRANPGLRLPTIQVWQRHLDFEYEKACQMRPNFGCGLGVPSHEWWYDVFWNTAIGVFEEYDYPVEAHLVPYFNEIVDKLYFEDFAGPGAWELFPGSRNALETLAAWRERGGPSLGCLANSDERLLTVLHNLDIAHYFDFVLTSRDLGKELPDPSVFEMAQLRAGVQNADRCLHVGSDFDRDYLGSLAAGWQAMMIGNIERERLREVPQRGYKRIITDIGWMPDDLGLPDTGMHFVTRRRGVFGGELHEPEFLYEDVNDRMAEGLPIIGPGGWIPPPLKGHPSERQ